MQCRVDPRGLVVVTPELQEAFRRSKCLIPAAGNLPEGVASVASVSTAAMLPVGGKPVIFWAMRYLIEVGFRDFRVGVSRRGLAIENYVDFMFGETVNVDWIECSPTKSVGHSVSNLCSGQTGSALIVLGDTIFRFGDHELQLERPWVLTNDIQEPSQWCVVSTDSKGQISHWYDKQPDAPSSAAAIGVYWIPDVAAAAALELAPDQNVEMSEFVSKASGSSGVYAVPAGEWFDCGHPETFSNSRRSVLAARSFNTLQFDDVLGTIRKTSDDRSRLIDEISYLNSVPAGLRSLFPNVIESSQDTRQPFVTMEYYGYPTLAELSLYYQLHPSIWDWIMSRLSQLLAEFRKYPAAVSPEQQFEMYVEKTYSRIEQSKSDKALRSMIEADSVVLNGQRLHGMIHLRPRIMAAVASLGGSATGAIIHGDLCFSNILFDIRTGVCKLLDPRGRFGAPGLHGDQRYDVAKLHHSIVGLYDHLVAGLFSVNDLGENRFSLRVPQTVLHERIEKSYRKHVLAGYEEDEIGLITGLILVGLPPLHTESRSRQVALYLKGLELVNKALRTAVPA
jgi:dTDP-glucose pyrophosphorylase